MKIQVYCQSGQPVGDDNRAKYQEEWKAFYDKAEERARIRHVEGPASDQYHVLMQRYLNFGERQLVKKYNGKVEVELPKTMKAWKKLVTEFHDTPLIIAKRADKDELILIVADLMQG